MRLEFNTRREVTKGMHKALSTMKSFFVGLGRDDEGNVSVQQIMGIIFAVILVVVTEKLPPTPATV